MTRWKAFVMIALLFSFALPLRAWSSLEVATGKVEITGPVGYPMGGYGARKGVSQGVHDPLMAKVLLIKAGDQQLGIVTYDSVGFRSTRIAKEAKEKLGIPFLLQISSHSHSAPVPKDRDNPEGDPWVVSVEDKVLASLKAAQARFVPAQVSVIETKVLLGSNRRKVNPDGTVTMFWRNAERVPTSPIDPSVGILRFTDSRGKVLALVVNYACHAVVLGPDNLQYSADWPGFMYRYLEAKLGDPAICYWIPGAGGDVNPFNDKQPVNQDGFGVAQKYGETMGDTVLAALSRMKPAASDFRLQIGQEIFPFKERFDAQKNMPVQVTYALLGEDTGFVAIPGEVFVSHQIDLKARSPLRHTFLFGYANGGEGVGAGYVPTIEAAMQGGYGASYSTRIEVGAGERMIDRAIIWIYERLGKLRDVPDTARP